MKLRREKIKNLSYPNHLGQSKLFIKANGRPLLNFSTAHAIRVYIIDLPKPLLIFLRFCTLLANHKLQIIFQQKKLPVDFNKIIKIYVINL